MMTLFPERPRGGQTEHSPPPPIHTENVESTRTATGCAGIGSSFAEIIGTLMRPLIGALSALFLTGCATPPPRIAGPEAPKTILVVATPGLQALFGAAQHRPGAPVQDISVDFHFSASADPAFCDFTAEWRAKHPPRRGLFGGVAANTAREAAAYAAARDARGVRRPNTIVFRKGMSQTLAAGGDGTRGNWTFLLPLRDWIKPGEQASLTSASVAGYARIALTSGERRWVSFMPGSNVSWTRPAARITLVGPFHLEVAGERVDLTLAPGDEEAIRAEAARVTARPAGDIVFAPLGTASAVRCPDAPDRPASQ